MAFFEITRKSPLEAIASKYNQFKQVSKIASESVKWPKKILNRGEESKLAEKLLKRSSELFTIKLWVYVSSPIQQYTWWNHETHERDWKERQYRFDKRDI